jgi:hypothetical protein
LDTSIGRVGVKLRPLNTPKGTGLGAATSGPAAASGGPTSARDGDPCQVTNRDTKRVNVAPLPRLGDGEFTVKVGTLARYPLPMECGSYRSRVELLSIEILFIYSPLERHRYSGSQSPACFPNQTMRNPAHGIARSLAASNRCSCCVSSSADNLLCILPRRVRISLDCYGSADSG